MRVGAGDGARHRLFVLCAAEREGQASAIFVNEKLLQPPRFRKRETLGPPRFRKRETLGPLPYGGGVVWSSVVRTHAEP